MIRIREITLPPEHNVAQLSYEASRALRVSPSKIRGVTIVRRSLDARKKPDVRYVYTIDVAVDGSENKILKQSGCKKATISADKYYKVPKCNKNPTFFSYLDAWNALPNTMICYKVIQTRSCLNNHIFLKNNFHCKAPSN